MLYIEVLETIVVCAFYVCAVLRRERGKLVLKRPLLCCDIFPRVTSRSFGRALKYGARFLHLKLDYLYWGLNGSVVVLNCIKTCVLK